MHYGVTASIDVVQALGDSKRTGILKIRDEKISAILWLRAGTIVKAELLTNLGQPLSLKDIIFQVLKITEPELSWKEDEATVLAHSGSERISIEQALMEYVSQMDGSLRPKFVLRDLTHNRTFTLFNGRNLIGRKNICGIVISHPTISSEHAILKVFGDSVIVIDLESLNGTYVNEDEVNGESPLTLSDILAVGDIKLKLEERAPDNVNDTTYLGHVDTHKNSAPDSSPARSSDPMTV